MPQLYLISSKKANPWESGRAAGPAGTATWACLGTHLPGFTAAPAGIRGDPEAPAAWLLGQESELPDGTAHKGAQVPTGGAKHTAAASQEEEGHRADEQVSRLHAAPPERGRKECVSRPSCAPRGGPPRVGGCYQRDLALRKK